MRVNIRRMVVSLARTVIASIAVVVMVACGRAWWIVETADERIHQNAVAALVPDDPNIRTVQPSADVLASAEDNRLPDDPSGTTAAENILLLGLDTRPANSTGPGGGTSQSDVIMVAHVSADRQRLDLVSIPRDLMIPAPTCKA